MKSKSIGNFYRGFREKIINFPFSCMFELTYRCSLNCIHCYCKGSENNGKELTTAEIRRIMDELHSEGCLWFCPTGGDPLVRDDFLDIYSYAKQKGFLITILTSGQLFTKDIINYLAKYPPFSIEITLNGITKETYEAITQVEGSFEKAIENIKKLKENKIPVFLKTNCLKQNKHELGKIKRWVEDLLGEPEKKVYHFRYDPVINPRLNRDKSPCSYRLSVEELLEARKQDMDIWEEHKDVMHQKAPDLKRDKRFLYRCNTWLSEFYISPFGRLRPCLFYDKFSTDLKTNSLKDAFYRFPSQILNEQFKTNSKCKNCALRSICYICPARAFLETGDEEAPVEYYCALAKETARQIKKYQPTNSKI